MLTTIKECNQSINSINSIEIDSYETNKEITHRKEEIKSNNIIKQYEKWLTMGMKQNKTSANMIQIMKYKHDSIH